MKENVCEGCFYNRPMRAWGEVIEACHYGLETGKELFGKASDETYCSGFEPAEKQMELSL